MSSHWTYLESIIIFSANLISSNLAIQADRKKYLYYLYILTPTRCISITCHDIITINNNHLLLIKTTFKIKNKKAIFEIIILSFSAWV